MILTAGLVLLVGLSFAGCNSDTSQTSDGIEDHAHSHETEKPSRPPMAVMDVKLPEDADLDEVVKQAVISIEEGKKTGDMSAVMNQGIMKLRAVNKVDSNHLGAIYQLGIFSIESGQLQKALKRFEKLVLLQPENQEYQKKLAEIRERLN